MTIDGNNFNDPSEINKRIIKLFIRMLERELLKEDYTKLTSKDMPMQWMCRLGLKNFLDQDGLMVRFIAYPKNRKFSEYLSTVKNLMPGSTNEEG